MLETIGFKTSAFAVISAIYTSAVILLIYHLNHQDWRQKGRYFFFVIGFFPYWNHSPILHINFYLSGRWDPIGGPV